MPEGPSKSGPSFSRSLLAILGGQAACALLGVGIEVFYTRVLGAEGTGLTKLCLMAVAACALIGGLGVEYPALVWAAERKHRHVEWFPGVVWCGVIGCVLADGLWASAYWLFRPTFLQGITPAMAWLIFITIPCTVFFSYLMAIIAGQERFGLRAGVALIEQIVSLVALGGLVMAFGSKAELAVTANLLATILGVGVCMFAIREYLRVPPLTVPVASQMRSALGLALPAIMGNLATFLNYRLDVFVVNYFLNPAAVGIYSLGVVVSEAVWQIPRAMALALFPRTARTAADEAAEFTCIVTRQVLLISSVTGLLIALLSPLLIPAVFGGRFASSVPVVWWILPGTISLSVAKILCADLAGRKKGYFASIFALLSFAVTIGLDFTLIPAKGINGAAIASSMSYLFNSVLLAVVAKRELKVTWKSLFVPTRSEWSVYCHLWSRYRNRLSVSAVAAALRKLNQIEIS